jgi:hypothetical protein
VAVASGEVWARKGGNRCSAVAVVARGPHARTEEGRLQAEGRRKALSPSRRVEFLLGACFFDDDEDFSPFPLPVPSLVFISYIIYLFF